MLLYFLYVIERIERGEILKNLVCIVAGLAYGDEGKGSIVDYLVRKHGACAVVRYNGGAQAGHRVVLPDGREHVFAQFGSGTLRSGALTHLSRFMLVEPLGMMNEYAHLRELGAGDAFLRTSIDELAPIITPFHIETNRILEYSRGEKRHGSCGLGIGETIEDLKELGKDMLFAGDLKDISMLRKKMSVIRDRKLAKVRGLLKDGEWEYGNEIIDWCVERYSEFVKKALIVEGDYLRSILSRGNVIFEGAQGMLLDPNFGVRPYVTKTDITFRNALTLLTEAGFNGELTRVGVVRGYLTRHGAGPFATEDEKLTQLLPDRSNPENEWQGKFRVGHFDAPLIKRTLGAIGGVDELAITNLDRLIEIGMLKDKSEAREYAVKLADKLDVKLSILSFGPTAEDKESYYS